MVSEAGKPIQHYYGDIVRSLFLISAIILLVGFPLFSEHFQVSPFYSIAAIFVLVMAAGLASPAIIWSEVLNVFVSVIGFVFFEISALRIYYQDGLETRFLYANAFLGFIFLLAIYFSVKTLRATLSKKNLEQ